MQIMREYKVSLTWVLVIAVGTIVGPSFLSAVTPLGEQINVLAVTIAGDVVCSQCVGTNGDGTNDIKDGSITNAKIATSAVTKSKLASNSVDGGKISDGTISAADLGPDSVGASEIKGVTKLRFATCSTSSTFVSANAVFFLACSLPGVVPTDHIVGSQDSNFCFAITDVVAGTDRVSFFLHNACQSTVNIGTLTFKLVIFQN